MKATEQKRIKKHKFKSGSHLWVTSIFFSAYALTLIYPFLWLLINSFKNNGEYLDNSFGLPPGTWRFSNFIDAFSKLKVTGSDATFLGMFINSFIFATIGAVFSLVLSSMTAYVCARFKYRFLKVIYAVGIFTMILPIVGALPAQAKLMNTLGLTNNLIGVALLYASPFGFNFMLLYGAFKSISWEYAEAAMMDGCGHFRIFTRIMLPMVRPTLRALFIIQFIGVWNDYMTPMLYLKKMPTLSYGIYMYEQSMQYQGANYPIYFAGVIMSLIPVILLFIIFNKTLLENTVAGGIKG